MHRYRFHFIAIAALSWLSVEAMGHPYHASIAMVDFNPESQRLEVSLRVFPDDLENGLRERYGDATRLEDADVDTKILKLLKRDFLVLWKRARQEPAPTQSSTREVMKVRYDRGDISWVGKQVDAKSAWLYFEVTLDVTDGYELRNNVLLDCFDDQLNTVVLRHGKNRSTHQFSRRTVADETAGPTTQGRGGRED